MAVILELRAALRGLSAYRNLAGDPMLKEISNLLDALSQRNGERALDCYTAVFYGLRAEGYLGLGDWLHDRLRYEDAPYPDALSVGRADPALVTAARRDIDTFVLLAELDCDRILKGIQELLGEEFTPVVANLPRWTAGAPFSFASLTRFYEENGAGLFARWRAFLWEDGELTPVPDPDSPERDELLGYERQQEKVLANTRALVEGKPVNNVLLYGDSGTGKSATVKSLLSEPGLESLRLIEVGKESLGDMPHLIRTLGQQRQKFILFIDDLAFDQDDRTYSILKTILEGGLEKRPQNVAIYATSNRRNLVRQTFSDRTGDEIDASETIQEKTSLAERFGLRIPYLTMNKAEFLEMVEEMAALYGIELDQETLRAEAVKWEMHHPGRTPRVARQFIMSLMV